MLNAGFPELTARLVSPFSVKEVDRKNRCRTSYIHNSQKSWVVTEVPKIIFRVFTKYILFFSFFFFFNSDRVEESKNGVQTS